MPHVKANLGDAVIIKFHTCPKTSCYKKWTDLLHRQDLSKITLSTVVCSNHFEYGQPQPKSPHPSNSSSINVEVTQIKYWKNLMKEIMRLTGNIKILIQMVVTLQLNHFALIPVLKQLICTQMKNISQKFLN